MNVRVYGKTLQRWTTEIDDGRLKTLQTEISYKDYDVESGELRCQGSEDFSPDRERDVIAASWVWTWDGKRRNKGGHRFFECHGMITYRKHERSEVKRYLKTKYPDAVVIQLRKWL